MTKRASLFIVGIVLFVLKSTLVAYSEEMLVYESYTVEKGDTAIAISDKLNVRLEEFLDWNNLRNTSKIYPGDNLYYAPFRDASAISGSEETPFNGVTGRVLDLSTNQYIRDDVLVSLIDVNQVLFSTRVTRNGEFSLPAPDPADVELEKLKLLIEPPEPYASRIVDLDWSPGKSIRFHSTPVAHDLRHGGGAAYLTSLGTSIERNMAVPNANSCEVAGQYWNSIKDSTLPAYKKALYAHQIISGLSLDETTRLKSDCPDLATFSELDSDELKRVESIVRRYIVNSDTGDEIPELLAQHGTPSVVSIQIVAFAERQGILSHDEANEIMKRIVDSNQ